MDIFINQAEITMSEIKGFLRSHLSETAGTGKLQELMCTKKNDQEPPQQFLYSMIGLQQKISFQLKQESMDIPYDPMTIHEVFLHSIYQGPGLLDRR